MRPAVLLCVMLLMAACATSAGPRGAAASPTPSTTTASSYVSATPASPLPTAGPPTPLPRAASYARAQPAQAAGAAVAGTIAGRVNCACDGLIAMDVYAISTDGERFYVTQTVEGQSDWTILGVAPGQYFVYSVRRLYRSPGQVTSDPARFASGFTKAVPCGLDVTCTDHSPLPVSVRPGTVTKGIDVFDWYGPSYPLVPAAGPQAPVVPTSPPAFSTAEAAASFQGVLATSARQVGSASNCPVNVACFWLVSNVTGSGAAYYLAGAGSNGASITCALYLIGGGSAWRGFEASCRATPAFPVVGASGRVTFPLGETTGCVNVHATASLSGRVVACLPDGAAVQIDGGPTYSGAANGTSSNDYWWHIAGRGWMVHTYLRYG